MSALACRVTSDEAAHDAAVMAHEVKAKSAMSDYGHDARHKALDRALDKNGENIVADALSEDVSRGDCALIAHHIRNGNAFDLAYLMRRILISSLGDSLDDSTEAIALDMAGDA